MYYYILVLLSFASFCMQNLPIKKQGTHLFANSYLFFVLIFFISCFRYRVGTDFLSYQDIFNHDKLIEPLFYALIQIVKYLKGNYQIFVAIVFALAFGLKLYAFRKLSYPKGFFLSIMLFCSFYYIAYDMNAIRQGLALSVTLLACYYAHQKKKLQFYVTCVLACLIHYTAFIFIPFYFLLQFKLKKKTVLFICIICFILSANNIFELLINWSTTLLGNSHIAYQIQAYSTSDNFDNNILLSFSTVRRLFFFLLILFSYEKLDASDRTKAIIFWGGFTSIIIYLLFAKVGYFSTRLSAYYRITECIWLSYFPFIFHKKSTKGFILFFYLAYSLLQIHSALSAENNNLLPIQTIFF